MFEENTDQKYGIGFLLLKMASYWCFFTFIFLYVLSIYQDDLLYLRNIPIRHIYDNPKSYQSPAERYMNHLAITIEREDGVKLKGWFINNLDEQDRNVFRSEDLQNRRLVIFFHENAGNIGLRMDYYVQLYKMLGIDILAMAYRGYSDSTGEPSEQSLKQDAHAIMKYVSDNFARYYVDNGGIFILGRALGGAVAVEAYHKDQHKSMIDGIILENTFTSISDLVDQNLVFIRWFKSFFLNIGWRTIDIIPDIEAPLLFITGMNDDIVPPFQTQQLYNAATSSKFKEIAVIEKGQHNNTWAVDKHNYLRQLKYFMDKAN